MPGVVVPTLSHSQAFPVVKLRSKIIFFLSSNCFLSGFSLNNTKLTHAHWMWSSIEFCLFSTVKGTIKAMSWNHIHWRLNLSSCLIHLSSTLGQKRRFYSHEWELLTSIANDLLCYICIRVLPNKEWGWLFLSMREYFLKFKIKSQILKSITHIKIP